jgi:hypothetical protein
MIPNGSNVVATVITMLRFIIIAQLNPSPISPYILIPNVVAQFKRDGHVFWGLFIEVKKIMYAFMTIGGSIQWVAKCIVLKRKWINHEDKTTS